MNNSDILLLIVIIFVLFLLSLLIYILCYSCKDCVKANKLLSILIKKFRYSLPIRTIIEIYLPSNVAALITLNTIKLDNSFEIFSLTLASVFGFLFALFPFIVTAFIAKHQYTLRIDKDLQERFLPFVDELNLSKKLAIWFMPVFLFQRLSMSIIIVLLLNNFFVQILTLVFL